MKMKIDWFLLGMGAAVLLAWWFPGPGAAGGWMHAGALTKGGVALIFFLHGLLLPFEALKAGTLRWPVHLVVQAGTYLLFPLLGLVLFAIPGLSGDARLGLFFLCALPSTVSSSVALTAAARGNVPIAVFNATLSNLIGVLLTPLWVGVVAKATGQVLPLGEVILDLVRWLVLPLVVGQLLRPWWGAWAKAHKSSVSFVDRSVIVLLVYTSFCESVRQGVWTTYGWSNVVVIAGISFVLFFIVMGMMRGVCRTFHFSRADEIVAMFCGSQKTLAAGIPMAQLIFAGHPGMGLILLPIMIYHPLQLVLSSMFASRWAQRTTD